MAKTIFTSLLCLSVTLTVTPAGAVRSRSAARQSTATATAAAQYRTLAITTPSLPSGGRNTDYAAIVIAVGGLAPYSFSVTAGSLPAGLMLNASTGTIRGVPTTSGTSSFTIQVTDSENPAARAQQNLSIAIVG